MPAELELLESAQSVLETMFFAESEPAPPPVVLEQNAATDQALATAQALPAEQAPVEQIFIEIGFDGQLRGGLSIGMPESIARGLAGSFAGLRHLEQIPRETVDQVACELANMICGATLTRFDTDALFTLGSPFVRQEAPAPRQKPATSECWLQIPDMGDGLMHLAFAIEDAP